MRHCDTMIRIRRIKCDRNCIRIRTITTSTAIRAMMISSIRCPDVSVSSWRRTDCICDIRSKYRRMCSCEQAHLGSVSDFVVHRSGASFDFQCVAQRVKIACSEHSKHRLAFSDRTAYLPRLAQPNINLGCRRNFPCSSSILV